MVSKSNLPFQEPVFRFHLCFLVCISNRASSWWTFFKNDPSKTPGKGAFCWPLQAFLLGAVKILLVGGSEQGPRVPSPTWTKGIMIDSKSAKMWGDDATFTLLGGCHNCKHSTYSVLWTMVSSYYTPTRSPPIDGGFSLEFLMTLDNTTVLKIIMCILRFLIIGITWK